MDIRIECPVLYTITRVVLQFSLRHDYEEDERPLEKFKDGNKYIMSISSDGTIPGWDGPDRYLYLKVCDQGQYAIYGRRVGGEEECILDIDNDYVPEFIPNEWGDYIDLKIVAGRVVNWGGFFTAAKVKEYIDRQSKE